MLQQISRILLGLIVTMCSYSQNTYTAPQFEDTKRLEKIQNLFPLIDQIYCDYATKHHIPGYAFGVVVDGKLVYSGAGGYLDLKNKIKATPQSKFRVASMTKSFTAMSVLKLRDERKLKLDDPISKYIPELNIHALSSDSPEITVRDLLTHTAGFPSDDHWGDRQLHMDTPEFLNLIKNGFSFSNTPETNFEYSNLGYALLGLIIERISDNSHQEYIAKNIWQPLNMNQSYWEITKVPAQELAHGYRWLDKKWQTEPMLSDGAFAAMGGMISSIEDFALYVSLHMNAWPPRNAAENGPLKRSSIREMQQARQFNALDSKFKILPNKHKTIASAYGYGLRWLRDTKGTTFIGHSGGLPGFGSNWLIAPDYGVGLIFFANNTYAHAEAVDLYVLYEIIKRAQLQTRQVIPSPILQQRQQQLIKLISNWTSENAKGVVADNFFLDDTLKAREQLSMKIFNKSGKILKIHNIKAENQLHGAFIMEGEKSNIEIHFMLSPQQPALIQEISMKIIK